MMVYLHPEGKTVFLKGTKVWFEVLGRQSSFIKHEGKWYLRLPHDLYADHRKAAAHQTQTIIKERYGDGTASLYFSQYDSGSRNFRKYTYGDSVTIGSSIEDDIYVQDTNMKAFRLVRTGNGLRLIEDDNSRELTSGSRFLYLNLCIVIHSDFLMINCPANIYVSLERYQLPEPDGPFPEAEARSLHPVYRSPVFNDHLQTTLEEPQKISSFRRMPLVFSVGPALTMSSAALLVGSISVYRGWMNGRQIADMLPMILLPGVMVISTLVWTPLQRIYERINEKKQTRKRINDFTHYIDNRMLEASQFMAAYDASVQALFPLLSTRTDTAELYTRMPFHQDFLYVRLGTGTHQFAMEYDIRFRLEREDPLYPLLQRLLENTAMETLFLLDLKERRSYAVIGENTAMYILMQLCWFHSPHVLKVSIAADRCWFQEHRDVFRIPHALLGRAGTGLRLFASDENELQTINNELNDRPETMVLFVFGSFEEEVSGFPGTIVYCTEKNRIPYESEVLITASGTYNCDNKQASFVPDAVSTEDLHRLFQNLQRLSFHRDEDLYLSTGPSFFDLYEISAAQEAAVEKRWRTNRVKDAVKAVIGLQENGRPVILDLHEKGQGPHGLIAGMTGSGKSELLITLILSLAVSYSPAELQFVMIDFKGGGAAGTLIHGEYRLPHISSVLTDLDDQIIDRALVSFQNECRRREELFAQLGIYSHSPVMDIHQYQESWSPDSGLPYLPELVIIVDEFAELKKSFPDFMKDLISLARVGRSLGIHLILATQKPAGIVDEQIWSNSRFKICLRVQDKQDSMEVLHDECASRLRTPGSFWMLCDGTLRRGNCGWTGMAAERNACAVSLLSLQAQCIRTVQTQHSSVSQLNALLKEIHRVQMQQKYAVHALWMDPLVSVKKEEIRSEHGVLALIDDYWTNSRKELALEPYGSWYIDSLNRTEKLSFLSVVMTSVLQSTAQQLVIINDNMPELPSWKETGRLSGSLRSTDAYRMKWFADDLASGRCRDTAIIITDISTFMDPGRNAQYLNYWLENTEMLKITLIVFASAAQSIPFRMLSLFRRRLSLQNENQQDLSLLFERNVTQSVKEEKHGLLRDERILTFCWPELPIPDPSCIPGNSYSVPRMPDHLCPEDPEVIGVWMKDCTDFRIPSGTVIVYNSTYPVQAIQNRLIRAGRTVGYAYGTEAADTDILLMSEEQFRKIPASSYPGLLYCGSRYRSYYSLPIVREEIPEHCGVYVHDGKGEVIRLADTE